MSHETDYSGMTPLVAHAAAVSDVKFWLGDRYDEMTEKLRQEPQPSIGAFMNIYAPFAGVQGYPARAWYHEIWPYG